MLFCKFLYVSWPEIFTFDKHAFWLIENSIIIFQKNFINQYLIKCDALRDFFQSLFGVCMIVGTNANACSRFFFYHPVVSIRLYELAWRSNGSFKFQTLKCQSNGLGSSTSSSLTTFEFCFLISKYHENCNAMSSFTVIRHVPLRHYKHFHFHCSSMFSLLVCYIFYSLFTVFFKKHWHFYVFV